MLGKMAWIFLLAALLVPRSADAQLFSAKKWVLKRSYQGVTAPLIVARFDGEIQLPGLSMDASQEKLCWDAAMLMLKEYPSFRFFCSKE
jgi:hypothetical protein